MVSTTPINNLFYGGYSNHVYAYVRSFSGLAAEKPPQNNQIMREDAFSYQVLCVNAPMAVDTNLLTNCLPISEATPGNWRAICAKCG